MSTAGPAVRTTSPRTPSPRTQTVSIVTAAAGQNVIYTVVTTFMLLYLLEYAGFGPGQIAVATTVIAVVRIVDAIGDPLVGSLIDMTRTRWGKLRPFILFSAVPVAVLTTLLFAIPDIGRDGEVVYFAVAYVVWGFAYTFCDVPLWGLIGSAFTDPVRRNRTVGFVRAFGAISLGLATLGLPQLARVLSFADQATGEGWSRSVAIVATLGMGVYLLAFFNVRERDSAAAQKRLGFRQLFRALFHNAPLLLVLLGSVLGFGRFVVQAGGAVFAVIAYDDQGLFTLLGAGIILGLVGSSFFTPLLLRHWSARTLAIACGVGGALVSVLMYLFGFQNIVSVVIFLALSGVVIGVFNVLQPSMIADSVDAAEERTGVRNDGISFATLTFTAKVMSALATAVFGVVVVIAGYQAGIAVTPGMQNTVWIGMTLIPAVSSLLSAIPFWFYRIDARRPAKE
ncbi:MAG TPA: glycoside-pentoside-hexuronide (GPH):cation symporter [Pseudolysinimonas sp.]|nr:glycoside-pentoside-hexuronide (GPH):cation symporter [Pseudolysinimonas sp.]